MSVIGILLSKLDINIGINGKKQLDDLDKKLKQTEKSTVLLNKATLAYAAALTAVGTVLVKVTKDGFAYNTALENSEAGLISLSVAVQDKSIPVMERYSEATKEATATLEKLEKINSQTPHTLNQTNQIYKSMYVSMKKLGASNEDMVEITRSLSVASGAAGIEFNSLLAGVDGLASGTVLANSDLGRFLSSLGLTNEALKKTDDVVGLVKNTLKDFKAADTMAVAVSNLDNAWSQLSGTITKDIFEDVKTSSKIFADVLNYLNKELKEFKELSEVDKKRESFSLMKDMKESVKLIDLYTYRIEQAEKTTDSFFDENFGSTKSEDIKGYKKQLKETTEQLDKQSIAYSNLYEVIKNGEESKPTVIVKENENILDERNELIEIYNKLSLDTESIRALKIKATDKSNQALQEEIWLLQDKNALEASPLQGPDMEAYYDSINTANELLKSSTDRLTESMLETYELMNGIWDTDQMENFFIIWEEKQTLINNKGIKADKDKEDSTKSTAGATQLLATSIAGAAKSESSLQKAMQITAVIAGGIAVLNQAKGDPYTAFARMAAMGITVGSILSQSGVSKGIQVSGGVGNEAAQESSSFYELNAATNDYGAIEFDSFIEGLNKATEVLESFGNVGSSTSSQLDSITAQLSKYYDLSNEVMRKQYTTVKGGLVIEDYVDSLINTNRTSSTGYLDGNIFTSVEYGHEDKVRTEMINYINANIAKYQGELSKIIVDQVSADLDYSLLDIDQLENLVGDFDQSGYTQILTEINDLAIKAKQNAGYLSASDQKALMDFYSLPNYIKGQDYAEAIKIIEKANTDLEKSYQKLLSSDISGLSSVFDSLQGVINSLQNSTNPVTNLEDFNKSMQESYEALNSGDLDALNESLKNTIKLSSVLNDSSLFGSSAEQQFEKLLALRNFQNIQEPIKTELDLLTIIKEQSVEQVEHLYEINKTVKKNLAIDRQILDNQLLTQLEGSV